MAILILLAKATHAALLNNQEMTIEISWFPVKLPEPVPLPNACSAQPAKRTASESYQTAKRKTFALSIVSKQKL
jgi:hypothetical protein